MKTKVFEAVEKKKQDKLNKRKGEQSKESGVPKKFMTQADVNKMIIQYICDGLVPLSTVENLSFKNIIINGFPSCQVPCRETITALLMKEYQLFVDAQIDIYRNVSHICVTVDCWTAHHR